MSIIASEDSGIIVCQLKWLIENIFSNTSNKSLLFNLFNIKTPFLMDDQAQKIAEKMASCDPVIQSPRKRLKRKRKLVPIVERIEELLYVKKEFEKLKKTESFQAFFSYIPTVSDYRQNNYPVRNAAKIFYENSKLLVPEVRGRNSSSEPVLKVENNSTYVIPSHSRYICGDVRNICDYLKDERFDIVVMDPPWENKHIRRKRKFSGISSSYWTMSVEDLKSVPLKSNLSSNSYVFIWITNNDRINNELLILLEDWDLKWITTWYWLKVTKSGTPISSFNEFSNGKLPYEKILVSQPLDTQSGEILPEKMLIVSTPSGIHSNKPPLKDILENYMNLSDKKCLELFGRNVTPNWTVVGLEALKLNDTIIHQELL